MADQKTYYRRTLELHAKLKRFGQVCIECGLKKAYDDFPKSPVTGRIKPNSPCTECQSKMVQREEIETRKIYRGCPACKQRRRPSAFHPSGLCFVCWSEQQEINKRLRKTCVVCHVEKKPNEFTDEGYCTDCATFIAVHMCKCCEKGFQTPEILPDTSVCIYCAFDRGTEEDIRGLRKMVRADRLSASKMTEFIKTLKTGT